ncbi:hypothetical protein, partial [Helicobacter sp. 13S00482-2]|uniref:hypothetical protein n=1 Tax=Helicobacter sp. 13S00482-2 TaxID=1476200 RepID=UPI001C60378D
MFPFKAQAIDTQTCSADDNTCAQFKLITNSDRQIQKITKINLLPPYDHTFDNSNIPQIFKGLITEMTLIGYELQAPSLIFDTAGSTINIKDSKIATSMKGIFGTMVIDNSIINGDMLIPGGGDKSQISLINNSSITGKLSTNIRNNSYDQVKFTLNSGSLNLLSGSSAFITLDANTGTNTLRMQDTFLRLTQNSTFTGTLTAIGNNELVAGEGSDLNLKDNSVFEGILMADYSKNFNNNITIGSNTKLLLKANLSSNKLGNVKTGDIGHWDGTLNTTGSGNYLEMDSSVATSAGDWVFLGLQYNSTYNGTLFTKGTKNFIGGVGSLTLAAGSYFDGILLLIDQSSFLNPDGDVILEGGSVFQGTFQANILTLKAANNFLYYDPDTTYLNLNTDSYFKTLKIISGTHSISDIISSSITSPILNMGGTLYMNFVGEKDDKNAKPSGQPFRGTALFEGDIYTYKGDTNLDLTNTFYLSSGGSEMVSSIFELLSNLEKEQEKTGDQISKDELINTVKKMVDQKIKPTTILAQGNGRNYISYDADNFANETPGAIKTGITFRIAKLFIPSVFNIYTRDNAENNFGISGELDLKTNIYYSGGITNFILAEHSAIDSSVQKNERTEYSRNKEENAANGTINDRIFSNGLIIHLDGKKANELLKDYREIFPINFLGLSVDKTSAYTQLAQEKTCASDSTKCLKDDDST